MHTWLLEKTIALTRQIFVGKVMCLLLNMLSRFIMVFLPRSKYLLISCLQSPSAMILEPKKIKSLTVSPSICHEVKGPDAMILVFWMLSFTLQYYSGFCHTLTWISHTCTCAPIVNPHPIPQGHPSASALSTLSHALNLDWRSVSHMIIHMFQCYSLKLSHPHLIPQSPKDCSLYLCLFCCLTYRVIITIFLNSTYMC